jgi:hypothetical protein
MPLLATPYTESYVRHQHFAVCTAHVICLQHASMFFATFPLAAKSLEQHVSPRLFAAWVLKHSSACYMGIQLLQIPLRAGCPPPRLPPTDTRTHTHKRSVEMRCSCVPRTKKLEPNVYQRLIVCKIEKTTYARTGQAQKVGMGTGHTRLTSDMTLWIPSLMSVITANAVDRITTHMTRKLNNCVLTRERMEFRTCTRTRTRTRAVCSRKQWADQNKHACIHK